MYLKKRGENVVLVTNDVGLRVKAVLHELCVESYEPTIHEQYIALNKTRKRYRRYHRG